MVAQQGRQGAEVSWCHEAAESRRSLPTARQHLQPSHPNQGNDVGGFTSIIHMIGTTASGCAVSIGRMQSTSKLGLQLLDVTSCSKFNPTTSQVV